MKTIAIIFMMALGLTAQAMDVTGRVELKDSMTASSSCGSANSCSANSTIGFGLGATANVWDFASDWSLVTGGLLRQRVSSITASGTTASGTYLDLDIPVAVQWGLGAFNLRLGVDLGVKLSSTYSNIASSAVSDNALIVPVELGVDWKFIPNQMVTLVYESGTTLAAGQGSNPSLATSGILSLGYGYTF